MNEALYLSATFDHGYLQERISSWVFRRWSMFYVCLNSAMGLFLGWAFIGWFDFAVGGSWWLMAGVGMLALLTLAGFNWWDAMGMLQFQTRRLAI